MAAVIAKEGLRMWGDRSDNKQELFSEEDNYTFLGKGTDFKGKATFAGTVVRINGSFEGELSADDTVIIGEHAVVKGALTCGVVVCKGRIEANVTATQKVQMLKPAVLIGDVYSPSFSMEDGVVFHGRSHMDTSDLESYATRSQEQERVNLSHSAEH